MPTFPKLTERNIEIGMIVVEPGLHADFVFLNVAADFLKVGRPVVYVSAMRILESVRVACNKMSVRLTPAFQFVAVGELLNENLCCYRSNLRQQLLQRIQEQLNGLESGMLLVIDDLSSVCNGDLNEELKLLSQLRSLINDQSTLLFGTTRDPSSFGLHCSFKTSIKVVGSGFGKKVTGEIQIEETDDFALTPVISTFHYLAGERSAQFFYPGTVDVL
ncbi:hypothetical protein M3Y96_00227300 [Aphelenchoides besseyi]|nr:hypothetical protein M3Y96_00227300 [Aphelenchoides besseyi]